MDENNVRFGVDCVLLCTTREDLITTIIIQKKKIKMKMKI